MGSLFFSSVENADTFCKAIFHKRRDIADAILKFKQQPHHAKGWTKRLHVLFILRDV